MALGWLLAWSFADAIGHYPWALFSGFKASGLTVLIGGFLLLDLTEYFRHRIMHVGWLWRVHQVHHSDLDVDWSTELRFHPIEVLVSIALRFAVIVLLGIGGESVALFVLVALLVGMLQHSNVQLFKRLERIFGKILVTPGLHRVHHAAKQRCYNRNFAVVFVWWDMLFSTYQAPEGERVFGLTEYPAPGNSLRDLLLSPFRSPGPTRKDGLAP